MKTKCVFEHSTLNAIEESTRYIKIWTGEGTWSIKASVNAAAEHTRWALDWLSGIQSHVMELAPSVSSLRGICQHCGDIAERHYGPVRPLPSRIAELEAENARLRSVCAEAYQMAGALGASEKALDNLSAAAQGEPLPHETFLPHGPGPDSALITAVSAEGERYMSEKTRCIFEHSEAAGICQHCGDIAERHQGPIRPTVVDIAELEAENGRLKDELKEVAVKRDAIREITQLFMEAQSDFRDSNLQVKRLTRERDEALPVIEAARGIRHWHDSGRDNEGMIVSATKVRELWKALASYDAARTQSAQGVKSQDAEEKTGA